MQQKKSLPKNSERGTTLVEILVVLVVIAILSSIAIFSLLAPKKYKAEDQALILIDLTREAQQLALSKKRTFRVQINAGSQTINLIDENEPADANNDGNTDDPTAANDLVVKTIRFNSEYVQVGAAPANMSGTPTEITPVSTIPFARSRAVMRFKTNGTVHNAGDNDIGDNSVATGRVIYVWTKNENDSSMQPTESDVLRAVTVLGTSGSTKLRICPMDRTTQGTLHCDGWAD